jgi:hypothetical protein
LTFFRTGGIIPVIFWKLLRENMHRLRCCFRRLSITAASAANRRITGAGVALPVSRHAGLGLTVSIVFRPCIACAMQIFLFL